MKTLIKLYYVLIAVTIVGIIVLFAIKSADAGTLYSPPSYGYGMAHSITGHVQPPIHVSPDYGAGRTITIPGHGTGHVSPDYGAGRTITMPPSNTYTVPSYNYGSGGNY